MASIKSVFNAGLGKVKEVADLSYDPTGNAELGPQVALGATAVLLAAGGLRLAQSGQKVSAIAVAATPSATADDTYLASAGYVDAQVAAVASPTKVTFSGATAFAAKDIVCLSVASGELALADASDENLSNVIGVVTANSTGAGPYTTIVQVDGEVLVEDLGAGGLSATVGTPLFVSATAGALSKTVAAGDWMTQVGFVSDQSADKILLQPRGFGQISA
jgi:hypothetical protein